MAHSTGRKYPCCQFLALVLLLLIMYLCCRALIWWLMCENWVRINLKTDGTQKYLGSISTDLCYLLATTPSIQGEWYLVFGMHGSPSTMHHFVHYAHSALYTMHLLHHTLCTTHPMYQLPLVFKFSLN